METGIVHRWRGGTLIADATPADAPLLVADSWLVTEGRVRALDAHRDRFLRGVHERTAIRRADAAAFWEAALAELPRSGDWFPRVEADAGGLLLRLRTAPPRQRSAVLWTSPVDPRRVPAIKGPDLGRLGTLRTRAVAAGADEAVILGPDGTVVDGAYSAIVWWLGDALVAPPASSPRVASVTARSLSVLAGALGVDVVEFAAEPGDLDGTEVWIVSALHGIRLATRWIDGPALAAEPGRLDLWRRRLDALRRPLP